VGVVQTASLDLIKPIPSMVSIQVYSDSRFALADVALADLANLRTDPTALLWVDLSAPTPEETKQVLEDVFAFHPLAIEDCVSDSPFPKTEAYEEFFYIVLHIPVSSPSGELVLHELDAFISKGFLVTYHRHPIAAVEQTFARYARPGGPLVRGPDRFLHSVFDLGMAGIKPTLNTFRRSVEEVQEQVLANIPAEQLFPRVVALRKQTSRLRQFLRPQHAIAVDLASGKHKIIRSTLLPYFRDLAEELARHEAETANCADQLIISFRVFLNKSSHEANDGIRILTGITALTFPTLLVGSWFGMNFEKMPELHHRLGYLGAVGVVLVGTVVIALFMRRKHWL
jgi:magnesium transporter